MSTEILSGENVVCLKNVIHSTESRWVTPGKSYYVYDISSDKSSILLIDDFGMLDWFDINNFINLSKQRNNIINEILK